MSIPITTVIKLKPVSGLDTECLRWMQSTALLVSQHTGFLRKELYKSVDQPGVLVTIFTFDSHENMDAWEGSKDRADQIEKGAQYVDSLVEKKQFTGLEFLFAATPKVNTAPVRWKMVALTIAIIFVLLNTFIPTVQVVLNFTGLPVLLQSLAGVSIMVASMAYLIMPFVTKILSPWLMNDAGRSR